MKRTYPLENLYPLQFEDLVIDICREIFGISCKNFSEGRDGGRDSRFNGISQSFPSSSSPWTGLTIIQAKHSTNPISSCSDKEFWSLDNKNSVLLKELNNLKTLVIEDKLDNYILFTNRKLSGGQHSKIINWLIQETGIKNVDLIGNEQINSYLDKYNLIADNFFPSNKLPFTFSEKDIRDVILVFKYEIDNINIDENYINDLLFISKEKKNELNNLSKDYFEHIQENSLSSFSKIENFLKDPKNINLRNYYEDTKSDLQAKIIIARKKFDTFDVILEYLYDYIVSNNEDKLKGTKKLVRVFLHFMYFNCDIGKKDDKA